MMRNRELLAVGLLWLAATSCAIADDEVRYVEKDGITFRETRRTVRQPLTETRFEEHNETVFREQYTTEMRDSYRTVYMPVTEYTYEPRVHGWWNPFAPSHVAYHLVPRTRWEPRVETVRTPITSREVVPETRVVRVPVRSLGFVEREEIDRVAVTPSPSQRTVSGGAVTSLAERPVGGISRMENDPPRQGTQVPMRVIQR
jgi:hypothetical protein